MLLPHLIAKTRPVAREENIVLCGTYRITVLTDALFRVEKSADGVFLDEATSRVWYRDLAPVSYTVEESKNEVKIKTSRATLVLSLVGKEGYVLLDGKKCPLDNRGNLGGTCRTLDNCDGAWRLHDNGKERVKLDTGILSRAGVAVIDDSDSLVLGADGKLCLRTTKGTDKYIFAYGQDYRGALQGLYAITGAPQVLPRFALGNWWSRNITYTERSYLHLMDDFAARDIHFTAACIDMDWHWSHTLDEEKGITASGKNDEFHGGANGWTGYSWNTKLFPDPKGFLAKLKARGMHMSLNVHPADGIRYFEDIYPEMAKAMGIDPATEECVRFDITSDRFINAYFDVLHKPLEEDGIAFWWIDWQQGTQSKIPGLDPLWSLNHYHTLDNAKKGTPLILSRYAGLGSHRYPLGFSGDTYITWDSLDFIPYFTANASNVGYTWWSHDIGGFMRGEKSDELYVRYLQFGAFSPINRIHGTILPVVGKEPWMYMNGMGSIAEKYLRLRHRLIPFLSSASFETTYHARPLVEPMYYEYPQEDAAYKHKNQYLFGGQLLVRPVTHKGDRVGLACEKVWLPEGRWVDIFTSDQYTGGRVVDMVRWADSSPTLLRAGGILPLDDRAHPDDTAYPDAMRYLLATGDGAYTLHEGKDEVWAHTHLTSKGTEGVQTLTIMADGNTEILPSRRVTLEFVDILTGEVSVTKNGEHIPFTWDDNHALTVTIPDFGADGVYQIKVRYTRDCEKEKDTRIFDSLRRLEGHNLTKMALWDAMKGKTPAEREALILASKLFTPRGKKRLVEVLYS